MLAISICTGYLPLGVLATKALCSCSRCAKENRTYLDLDMPEIHPQFLQQRRLPLITLRPEGCQPARPQPALLPHPPAHSPDPLPEGGATAGAEARARAAAGVGAGAGMRGRAVVVAILSLGGGGVAGYGLRVGGRVELEV